MQNDERIQAVQFDGTKRSNKEDTKGTSSTIRQYKTVINETTITEKKIKKSKETKNDANGDERKQNKMTTQKGGTECRSVRNCGTRQNE